MHKLYRQVWAFGLMAITFAILFFMLGLFKAQEARSACGDQLAVYRAIEANSNDPYQGSGTSCVSGVGIYGYEYQCVEFVNRFYSIVKNWRNMKGGGHARDYFPNAGISGTKQYGLEQHHNGSANCPRQDDILCFDYGNYGHVAVIINVDPINGRVYFIEQNWDPTGVCFLPLTISDGTYRIGNRGSYWIQGWLRKPYSFGPSNSSVKWHPDGTLIRLKGGNNPHVYLIDQGKRKRITSEQIFSANQFDWNKVIDVGQAEIDCLPEGENINVPPRIIKGSGQAVYILFNGTFKRRFGAEDGHTGPDVFEGLGYTWGMIEQISDSELNSYPLDPCSPVLFSPFPDGHLIQNGSDSTVYVITNGKKRAIANPIVFERLGYKWDCIIDISKTNFNIADIPTIEPEIDEDMIAQCGQSCTLNPGQGAPDQTTTNKFIEAYNLEGGEATMGCATANVDTFNNTFYSPPIAGYYQNFNDGSYGTCSIDYVPGYPSAYSIKWGFYATFMSRDSEIGQDVYTLLVAPTDNERDSSSNSVVGTVYAWQPFIKGSMYYFDDSHILDGTTFEGYFDGKITYVWGHISERYEWEGGRNGDLGLPLFDEEYYGTQDSWEWWYQWFEKGFIWFAKHSSYGEWTFAYQRTADVYSNGEWLELGWIKH
jgi:hypothetical protein